MALSARRVRISPRGAHDGADSISERGERLQAAHQDVEQALARGLFSHVAVAAGENNVVDLLDMGAQNRERRSEFGTELKLDAGSAGDWPARPVRTNDRRAATSAHRSPYRGR